VRPDALPCDQLVLAVAIQICERQRVRLRPRFVDDVRLPDGRAVRLLLPPIETNIVPAPENDVEATILVPPHSPEWRQLTSQFAMCAV
jgi:hypothetical protein